MTRCFEAINLKKTSATKLTCQFLDRPSVQNWFKDWFWINKIMCVITSESELFLKQFWSNSMWNGSELIHNCFRNVHFE